MEPYRLKRWGYSGTQLNFYSCARPGRSKGANGSVDDTVVLKWLEGIPKGKSTTIISLLGHKPNGMSEYSFYSFDQDTFESWIETNSPYPINVIPHPTEDFVTIPEEALKSIKTDVLECLKRGDTVLLVDSGGVTRSGAVCRYLRFSEDSRS